MAARLADLEITGVLSRSDRNWACWRVQVTDGRRVILRDVGGVGERLVTREVRRAFRWQAFAVGAVSRRHCDHGELFRRYVQHRDVVVGMFITSSANENRSLDSITACVVAKQRK
jgi:hypothetical protein